MSNLKRRVSTSYSQMSRGTNVSVGYLSCSGRPAFHSLHSCSVATTYTYCPKMMRPGSEHEQRSYRANTQLQFSGRTIHLIPEAFDIIESIDDKNGILRHLSLHRGEESTSSRLFRARICMLVSTVNTQFTCSTNLCTHRERCSACHQKVRRL